MNEGNRPSRITSDNGLTETLLANAVIVAAFAMRVWGLDAKGLAYDESATALMSRASIPEIVYFHWVAAYEHLPLWVLLMRWWSQLAGQSEFALRYTAVLAGVAVIPLMIALLRKVEKTNVAWRFLTASMVALSPVLLFYSQEARMYTLVTALGLSSMLLILTYMSSRDDDRRLYLLVISILLSWAMVALHYYSVILLVSVGLYLLSMQFAPQDREAKRRGQLTMVSLLVSAIPLLLWMTNSPGFRDTLTAVLGAKAVTPITARWFLTDLWQDASFGSIRWRPEQSWLGFLLIPVALTGAIAAFWRTLHGSQEAPVYLRMWPLLFAMVIALPLAVSAIAFRTLAIRYILYIMPFVYAFTAYGIMWFWRRNYVAGLVALVIVLTVSVAGLMHYYGPYTKSEYREAARYVLGRYKPGKDTVMLESPRQHLMARYYFGQDFPLQPIPPIDLPEYWPVNAPPVVPEEIDDVVQDRLRETDTLWVLLSAEPEVDKGEFLTKYLTAVSFKDDCKQWLDLRLCQFTSPRAVDFQVTKDAHVTYADELALYRVHLGLPEDEGGTDTDAPLRMRFDWAALKQPSVNYTLSVKVIDGDGVIVAQADQLPIGTLLPPTTWVAEDEKPGYVVVELPSELEEGQYLVVGNVYDPATMQNVAYRMTSGELSADPLALAELIVDESMELAPVGGNE